ncbi:MAG: cysteine-rich small domain-containing protein [Lachnospiraceae bacterium]|jgi:Zn-finger protein
MKNSSRFFSNNACEYFPCHKGINEEDFNCLFCFCPIYFKEGDCGGNYRILENGVKDCSDCILPHIPEGYDIIIDRLAK